MPLIEAGTPEGDKLICLNEFGERFDTVKRANTDEGWLEFYLIWPDECSTPVGIKPPKDCQKTMVDRKIQELITAKLHTSYQLVDKNTREVKYEVKWDINGNRVK